MAGSHEDAMLIVELAKFGAVSGLANALGAVMAEDFDPDGVEIGDISVRTVLGFNETVATLVKHELLDRELVYDWLWLAGSWERVGPAARRARERAGVPNLYANFEALANGQAMVGVGDASPSMAAATDAAPSAGVAGGRG